MTKNIDFGDDLKRSGLKNTKPRTAILDILEQSDQPIGAEQIFLELRQKDISVNLSTVYRTVEVLADKNIVTKLSIAGDNRALFEYNRMVHRHYLVCIECKKILPVYRCPLETYEKLLEEETHFAIVGHKLDIYGYCPECQERIQQGGKT